MLLTIIKVVVIVAIVALLVARIVAQRRRAMGSDNVKFNAPLTIALCVGALVVGVVAQLLH